MRLGNKIGYIHPIKTLSDAYQNLYHIDRVLAMRKLPNKFCPWYNREELLTLKQRFEHLVKKTEKLY